MPIVPSRPSPSLTHSKRKKWPMTGSAKSGLNNCT